MVITSLPLSLALPLPPLLLLKPPTIHLPIAFSAAAGGGTSLAARRMAWLGHTLVTGSLLIYAANLTRCAPALLRSVTVSLAAVTVVTSIWHARRIRQILLSAPPRSSSDAPALGLPSFVDTSTVQTL
jgi:hypothetical protein